MEKLPYEVVEQIMDQLPRLRYKFKMRCVSRGWKAVAEQYLLSVRSIKCHPDLSCKFGCRHRREEIAAEASVPDTFLNIMALCPNVEQLCLIPCSVNAFRAPPGSGDCGAGAWKHIIASQLDGVQCLAWDGLELDQPIRCQTLRHLSCARIEGPVVQSVIGHLEGLFYSNTSFKDWESLPHGLKFLRTGFEGKFAAILGSRAMRTIVDLELACPVPESLTFDPCLPQLQRLTIYAQARSSSRQQLDVLRSILDSSPNLKDLVLEILFDNDSLFLDYLPDFFLCVSRLQLKLFMVTLNKDHCIAESLFTMVIRSPDTIEATIRIPDLSDVELLTMTEWSKLRVLKLYSSKPAFRGTAFSTFIDLMFKQSLRLLVTSNVVFSRQEQELLIRTTRDAGVAVHFEDDWKKPVSAPFLTPFDGDKKFHRMTFTRA